MSNRPILIVDDDPTYRVLMREALERDNFTVLEASDGDEALSLFLNAQPRPELIIADVLMPRLDGFALCQELRKLREARHVPVLMVTALEDIESITRAYEVDATDFITKPFNWLILSHRVRYMLRASRALSEVVERQQHLRLLEGIAAAANSSSSVVAVVQLSIEKICSEFGWPYAQAYFAETAGGRVSGMSYRSADGFQWIQRANWSIPLAESSRDLTKEAEQGEPCSGRIDPAWAAKVSWFSPDAGVREAAAIPIVASAKTIGVIQFFAQEIDMSGGLPQLLAQIGTHVSRVAERSEAQDRLIHNASHDALTGLPNRVLLLDRLERAITLRRRNPSSHFALLFIDLDRFKIVNDSLGHLIGDRLLINVADRLSSVQRTADLLARPDPAPRSGVLARLGGDEFTLLLDDIRSASDALRVAGRLHDALSAPFTINATEVHVSASIGIATSETEYVSPSEVLRDADLAMYRAKSLGPGRTEVFDHTMHAAALWRLQLEARLRAAVEERQFELHYQPVVNLDTARIAGFEALLRWRDPSGLLVSPADFIAVAEDTGIIVNIGFWVIEEACQTVAGWNRQIDANSPLTIGINLSPRQFAHPDLVTRIDEIVAKTGIDPRVINFEITEGIAMADGETAIRILTQLRSLGVKISIDDFGTGFSSLSYLHRFPIDVLKIDRSFVSRLGEERGGRDLVKAIADLAKNLGFEIVAEGAETAPQVAALRSLGCDFYQGFFFSKAIPAAAALALMKGQTLASHTLASKSAAAADPGNGPSVALINVAPSRP